MGVGEGWGPCTTVNGDVGRGRGGREERVGGGRRSTISTIYDLRTIRSTIRGVRGRRRYKRAKKYIYVHIRIYVCVCVCIYK